MSEGFDNAQAVYEDLHTAWKARDLENCRALLPKMKIALTQMEFLPATDEGLRKKELVLARDALEVGAMWAVAVQETDQFERYMRQLKLYYFDYTNIPESPFKYELLGLDLLCMLSQNRIADFHVAIERLDTAVLTENTYIQYPIIMEQYIMEGSFNKVHLQRESSPADSYSFFIDTLMHTIRLEIADSCAAAYDKLTLSDLTQLLFADSEQETQAIISEHDDWVVEGNTIIFPETTEHNRAVDHEEMVGKALSFTRDLEAII